MQIQDMYKELNFDAVKALKNFSVIYPEVIAYPCGVTSGRKLLISVGDGYHVIDENTISRFYKTASEAYQDN